MAPHELRALAVDADRDPLLTDREHHDRHAKAPPVRLMPFTPLDDDVARPDVPIPMRHAVSVAASRRRAKLLARLTLGTLYHVGVIQPLPVDA